MLAEYLKVKDPGQWESSYREHVQRGEVAIDDWVWWWLWHQINWPGKDFSVFHQGVITEIKLMDINIRLVLGHENKMRFVELIVYSQNEYHPDFHHKQLVDPEQWRFPSIGNPAVDKPNYRWWEEYLFCKLYSQILIDHNGLDHIIEQLHRRLG
ncbi:MAG: hypothetical protein GY810_04095 [Aureispira sp.]|nr:hypothetical protein [Aureispira sp.]